MKLAARIIAYHGLSPMLRLSANSSPNSGQQSGSRRIWFQLPKVLTEAEVIEAEEELKALQSHAVAVVDRNLEARTARWISATDPVRFLQRALSVEREHRSNR
jgi:hypothetical protein